MPIRSGYPLSGFNWHFCRHINYAPNKRVGSPFCAQSVNAVAELVSKAVEPPQPRLEAFRIACMSGYNS